MPARIRFEFVIRGGPKEEEVLCEVTSDLEPPMIITGLSEHKVNISVLNPLPRGILFSQITVSAEGGAAHKIGLDIVSDLMSIKGGARGDNTIIITPLEVLLEQDTVTILVLGLSD